MTETLAVYGFGSLFTGAAQPRDVDLLLLHRSTDKESCQFAIACKALIKTLDPAADVLMLSQEEAASLGFFQRAETVLLGEVNSERINADIVDIVRTLGSFPSFRRSKAS